MHDCQNKATFTISEARWKGLHRVLSACMEHGYYIEDDGNIPRELASIVAFVNSGWLTSIVMKYGTKGTMRLELSVMPMALHRPETEHEDWALDVVDFAAASFSVALPGGGTTPYPAVFGREWGLARERESMAVAEAYYAQPSPNGVPLLSASQIRRQLNLHVPLA